MCSGRKSKNTQADFSRLAKRCSGGTRGAYTTIYNAIHGIQAAGNSNNAFAMKLGGGLDIPLTPHISIRPAEVDYLLTQFSANNIKANQNNFRYMFAVNIGLGRK
jgi:opacity protein-like surface antigen